MADETDYCAGLVREADKDRFLATLFAPADRRPDLFALYAFDLETAAVAHRVRDPVAGEIRLQWWHDALTGGADAAGHPIAEALRATLARYGIPKELALAVIDARRAALYADQNQSDAEFEVFASQTAGAIYQMAAHILAGAPDDATRLMAHHAGVATVCADVPERAAIMRRHLDATRALTAALPRDALPAFLRLALVARAQDRLPQWRKQWILWRASKDLAAWL